MKAALSLAVLVCLAGITSVDAQRRTITNADLERHRQKRIQAEEDYKQNYEKMGFVSPAELQRQIEQSRAQSLELSARLAAERIEREKLEIEKSRLNVELETLALQRDMQNAQMYGPNYGGNWGYPGYWPGYYGYGGYGYGHFGGSRYIGNPMNIGNGIPVVNYYGTPARGRRPVFQVPRATPVIRGRR
jgi:heme exporter protein D